MNTIIVSAPIANKPFNGGNAWTHLSYVLGFRKLGFDVYFVESIDPTSSPSPGVEMNRLYFKHVLESFQLQRKAALLSPDLRSLEGMSFNELLEVADAASLLLNISGHLDIEPLMRRIRCKAYLDLDPGFTQFWHGDRNTGFRVAGHDYYFTIGENIGAQDCPIPLDGIRWRRMRQPVVLEDWPVSDAADPTRFTTVATWRGPFGPVHRDGRTFGSKVHEFRKYVDLPTRTNGKFEIALDIHSGDDKDRELLLRNAWQLVPPREVVPEPFSFRRYVQTSAAEFSVAQQMYVETNSGWFSDRSVRYLASGKPVLIQDTGFRRNYPVDAGLIAFSTPQEARTGVQKITTEYSKHAAAARRIAEQYFDSKRVLGELLDQVNVCP